MMPGNNQEQNKQENVVSTHFYAPDTVGFIYCSKEKFTYFAGSKRAARATFGTPVKEMAKMFDNFAKSFQHRKNSNNPIIREIMKSLFELDHKIQKEKDECSNKKANKKPSEDDHFTIAKAAIETGHIPILLSELNVVQTFEKAARAVKPFEVREFLGQVPGAYPQCLEYLSKQNIMKMIAEFRASIVTKRYSISNTDEAFYFCNELIQKLDKEIINIDRQSMPQVEQFDLCSQFITKCYNFACEIPKRAPFEDLRKNIENFFSHNIHARNKTYSIQKAIADNLYEMLQNCVKTKLGIDPNAEELVLTADQVANLQYLLPLIQYLNSTDNPFARDGLFKQRHLMTTLHEEALSVYEKHEKKEIISILPWHQFRLSERSGGSSNNNACFPEKAFSHPAFNEDQVDQLLFGSEDEKPEEKPSTGRDFFKSFTSTFTRLMTEDGQSGAGSSSSASSRQNNRAQQLALPMPKEYLALEYRGPAPSSSSSGSDASSSR